MELQYNEPLYNKNSGNYCKTNDILQPSNSKMYGKEPDITNPSYNKHILPVPRDFVKSGFHYVLVLVFVFCWFCRLYDDKKYQIFPRK